MESTTYTQLDNPSMTFPLIHLNGNDGAKLGQQYFDALSALENFSQKFFAVEFHQRDYYPKGDQVWQKAIQERDEIKEKIKDIRKYLELLSAHCFEAVN
jgi:hypothetical protein